MALVDDSIVVPSLAPLYAGKFPPSAPPPPPPPPPPGLVLANVPSSGTVGAAATGATVTNTSSTSAASWALSSSGGLTISPTLGTLAAGASQAVSLTAAAPGAYSLLLENNSGGSVTGSPVTFTAAAAVATATAFTLTISPSSGTNGIPATVTVTPNAALSAACTVTLSASTGATLGVSTLSFASGATASLSTTVTRATSGSSTVSMSNSLGLTNTGSPRTFTSAGFAVGAQIATLSVVSESGTGVRPYVAAVLPLRGVVPAGNHVTNAAGTDVGDIICTHDDGSAAVVVFASTASATGAAALHVATGTPPAALTAAAIAAQVSSVAVAFGSPYGTASITDFSTPERVWWATSKVYCARYRIAAPTPGSTSMEAVIDIHAWSDRALVEVVVENGKMVTATPTAPSPATYGSATVSINGGAAIATVNSSGAFEGVHSKFRAWYASGWVGAGSTGLRVTQTHTELQLHPMFWKMAAASTASLTAYGALTYTPWSPVSHSTSMGATGDHPDIGPLPMWSARALQTGDYRAWNAVEVNDLGALTYDINYRDSTTGLPPTIAELNGKSMQTNWPNLYAGSHPAGGTGWKDSHHPACGLMGFIARPSPVFIEIAQKVAVWCGTWSRNDNGATERDTGIYASAYQTRGKAWGIRSLGHATFLTPDALPWKAAGKASLTANIAYLDEWRTAPLQTGLAIMWELRKDLPYNRNTWVSRVNYKLWQHHYLLWEVAKIASARIVAPANQTAADTCADWLLSHSVKWVNDQAATGSWRYMPEALVLGNASETSPAMTNAADYATQRATWVTGSPASVTGLWQRNATDMPQDYTSWLDDTLADVSRATYYWPTLVAAVDRGISGAATAYNTVINGITNFSTWVTGFGTEARYAATPINPPAPAGFAAGSVTGGSYNSTTKVWTPEKTGAGVVKALSWAEVPTGEWVKVAGGNLDALTASITAPGWDAGSLRWNEVMDGYGGFAIDQEGSRVWLVNAGGHNQTANNGIYRFDCFKMAWSVERQPSNRSEWSVSYQNLSGGLQSNTWTGCYESSVATPQLTDGSGLVFGPGDWYSDVLFWDRRPTSRHSYSAPIYRPDTDELISGCRTIWKYGIAAGDWTYHRMWDTLLDGAELQGVFDEVTGEYLMAGMGDGRKASRAYNLDTDTFAAWSCPWVGGPYENVLDCRHGRNITVWSPPWSNRTQTTYSVYNLDSRSNIVANATPTYAGGLSAASFRDTGSPVGGNGGICYIPPLDEYWIVHNLVAGISFLKLDPTTSPWTLSPKTFTGTLPISRNLPCKKMVWMPDLNAVLFATHESHTYVYKF